MQIPTQQIRLTLAAAATLLFSTTLYAGDITIKLSGKDEVPPVTTSASGSGTISVAADKSVSGTIKTKGIVGTMAHIHSAKAGENGPVVVPLNKSGEDGWVVPDGTKLSDDAYKAYQDGKLYVNVHSAAHPGGELRAQVPTKTAPMIDPPVRSSIGGGGGGY
jgi:CHRD domain